MRSLKDFMSSREQHVDHSDSASEDDHPSPAGLKTIYSGISVSFTMQSTQPNRLKGWKPFSIRPPVLLSFILLSLALIAVIEYLAQKSLKQGGLSLSVEADRSTAVMIYSQYVPTIIAVLYSLVWTWIDLDIRRIQPWLELSRPEGAHAESTLLLDYPFEFLAFIPLKAWKKKHWLVFLAGIIMMLVFWVLTPLQSAIFGTQSVTVMQSVSVTDTAGFATLDQQLDVLDTSVLQDAYAMTWLGQPPPDYTTSERAFVPFQSIGQGPNLMPEETWTTTATALTTDLDCWPAIVRKTELTDTYDFDNGRGCVAQLSLMITHSLSPNGSAVKYTILYIGYHEDAHLDWFLENPNCTQEASHQFLAIWTSTRTTDLTALFCEPSYKKQAVQMSISAQDRRPRDSTFTPLGDPVDIGPDEFNATAFEYLLGTGLPAKQMRRDYPRDMVIEQYNTIKDTRLDWPLTNMVGFAVGLINTTLDDLKDASTLGNAFASAHKLIFSAAMPQLMIPLELPTSQRPGTVQYTLYGVVVSRPISLIVEAVLGLVALLVGAILFLSCRTHSGLAKDPGGVAAALTIFQESRTLLDDFAPKDQYDDSTLEESVRGNRYRLAPTPSFGGQGLKIETLVAQGDNLDPISAHHTAGKPAQHKALSTISGGLFVVTLLAGIAVLVYLKTQEQLLGGLPRPSDNFEVLQLLENYVPTIFATLVEPFLVLLNRLRCVLQPFHDLRKGNKTARGTFETSYTTIPPQLAVIRAFMSGHVLLTSLCVVSLLANVLAVALGGLFNEQPVSVSYPTTMQQFQIPVLNRTTLYFSNDSVTSFYDHYYVTMSNLSSNTRLTPWTDTEFAYFPFLAPSDGRDNSSLVYRAETRGFGIEAVCSEIGTSPDSLPYANYTLSDDGSSNLDVMLHDDDGSVVKCWAGDLLRSSRLNLSAPITPGPLAMEVATSLSNQTYHQGIPQVCDRHVLMGWMRVDPADTKGSLNATYVHCTSLLRTARFSVAVDSSGYVLDSRRVGDFEDLATISPEETNLLLTDGTVAVGGGNGLAASTSIMYKDASWHNDTLTRDWVNYLLKLMANGTSLVDPQQGLPNATWTVPAVKTLYQRLFSVALGLNTGGVFKTTDNPTLLEGTMTVEETRIFMDEVAFIITIVILCLNVLVVTALYVQESRPFLPRLPSTIGSLLAYVAASRGVREYRPGNKIGIQDRRARAATATYSFGEFVGTDGREHVGVELAPFVKAADGAGSMRFRKWFRRSRKDSSSGSSNI